MSGKQHYSGDNMQYFSLRWNNHPVNLVSVFSGLYDSETLVDVTLAAGGKQILAHKILLSACSDYFQVLFSTNPCHHPIVILKDISFDDLQTVVQFMYNGIVNVSSDKLPGVLKTADTLQIKGLGEKFNEGVSHLIDGPSQNDVKGLAIKNRLLSVPSTQSGCGSGSRQLSTESLPEYLLRSRDFSPRQGSFESPHQSFDSQSGTFNPKQPPSPLPTTASSPPPKHLRKKFRRLSGCGSSSGEKNNSLEESSAVQKDASPGGSLLPSRQNSNEQDQPPSSSSKNNNASSGTTVARKKRELFSSARSSRSNESNQSSMSEHSKDDNSVKKSSMSSSGRSMSQEECNTIGRGGSKSPSNKSSSRKSEELKDDELVVSALTTKFKRGRFLLKRQSRLEKATPGDTSPLELSTPPIEKRSSDGGSYLSSSFENAMKSSPSSPLNYNYPTSLSPPVASQTNLSLPPPSSHIEPPLSPPFLHHPLGGPKSPLIPRDCHSPSLTFSPPQQQFHHPPPMKLPHVRVTPDTDGLKPDARSALPPVPNMSLLYPAFEHERRLYKSRSFEHDPFFNARSLFPAPSYPGGLLSSSSPQPMHPSGPPPIQHPPPSQSMLGTGSGDQFGHCPKARDGPALGCNFCWNTTDINGRILRRKTKYHCPECQANLCIVPCFQSYHEALDKEERPLHT